MITKPCRNCRGKGRDKTLRQRCTTGGHNGRDCETCGGLGVVEVNETTDVLETDEDERWARHSAETLNEIFDNEAGCDPETPSSNAGVNGPTVVI